MKTCATTRRYNPRDRCPSRHRQPRQGTRPQKPILCKVPFPSRMPAVRRLSLIAVLMAIAAVAIASPANAAGRRWFSGPRSPMSLGTPQNQAPYAPGASPYVTGHGTRPKYFVPPTNPRTPTSHMYGTPPGVVPGDWPTYAPLGFGGYRFPAVGSQAYR